MPAYQLRFKGAPLPDGTSAMLLLPGVTTNEAGSYSVTVTNLAGVPGYNYAVAGSTNLSD